MKRNETILVYGVTGLLVVILIVAVVFGNDGGVSPQTPVKNETAKHDLETLIRPPLIDASGKLAKKDKEAADGAAAEPKVQAPEPKAPLADGSSAAALHAQSPADVLAPEAAFLLRSKREGEFRKVTVQGGESFSVLLERFGVAQSRKDEVLRLNEHLGSVERLRAGDEIVLPFVEDALLIEAAKRRGERSRRGEPAPVRGSEVAKSDDKAAVATSTRDRKVKKGESLWKVANEVDSGNVTAAMERIRALNPTVVFDPLQEGTVLKVPR